MKYFQFNNDAECVYTQNMLDFMFENIETDKVFIHYTASEKVASKILSEGFRYEDTFYKTTQNVTPDLVELNYKHNLYHDYGNFIIVINIPLQLYEYILKYVNITLFNISAEDLLSKSVPEAEEIYTLPNIFIKGYIDYQQDTIQTNPLFKKNYNIEAFIKRIDMFAKMQDS